MILAIFSDVHGNLTALQAVLADIERRDVDRILFAGDLCLGGPRPAECVAELQARPVEGLYGNTDDNLLGRQQPPERFQQMVDWTRARLDEGHLRWLGELPFSIRVSPSANAGDDLLVVHANPHDVNAILFPPEPEQLQRWGRIRQSDREAADLIGGLDTAVLAFGHLHIPSQRQVNGVRLVNISSVNLPGDGDGRAKYGLLTWGEGQWQAEHVRIPYAVEEEIAAVRAARPAGWEEVVAMLEEKGFYPQQV